MNEDKLEKYVKDFIYELVDTFFGPWAVMLLLPLAGWHWGYWHTFWIYMIVQIPIHGATGSIRRAVTDE